MSTHPHPVRIVATDDLVRSRLTVFFRAFLAIPHYLWAFLLGMFYVLLDAACLIYIYIWQVTTIADI